MIEWNKNEDGIKPAQCYISNQILKEVFPDLLFKFYEKIIDSYI